MRRMIVGMQMSLDAKIEGPDGYADWVTEWSDTFDLEPDVDACVLGATMYPGYEAYWDAIARAPGEPLQLTGKMPTDGEIAYAEFAVRTAHYVLSSTLSSATWPNTSFVRSIRDLRNLKVQQGKDIYVVGGATTVATLIDEGLVDELRLTLHPLIAGPGKLLFGAKLGRQELELERVRELGSGRVGLTYRTVLQS